MRCPGCGNKIPDWAGGVCYTCGRIRSEERRFGIHPSAHKRARPAPALTRLQPLRAGNAGDDFTLPPWLTQVEPQSPAEHCPVCGEEVPQNRLEEHIELHRRMSTARLHREQPAKGPPSAPRNTATAANADAGAIPTATPDRIRRGGINRLLADIYNEPRLLSDILRDGDVSHPEIIRLASRNLPGFIEALLDTWRVAFVGELAPGAWYILTRSYGLDGRPPISVGLLARELGIAQETASKVLSETLSLLRTPVLRRDLESLTIIVARRHLRSEYA